MVPPQPLTSPLSPPAETLHSEGGAGKILRLIQGRNEYVIASLFIDRHAFSDDGECLA